MSEFREWVGLLGPWGALLTAWALLSAAGVLSIIVQTWLYRTELGHRALRWWCRRVGHDPIGDERGRPVTAFYVCGRCGKIGDRIP